jgi:hypothetical protein
LQLTCTYVKIKNNTTVYLVYTYNNEWLPETAEL